ncbi:MAG: type II secretion system F family protein [Parcubacteria group bacterium]|nr:type II secretion system F family protein [Parcubacteria group bacterium]
MPKFTYIARSAAGERITGEKEATNQKNLAEMLKSESVFLISAQVKGRKKLTQIDIFGFWKKIRPVSLLEKMMFSRNLAVMISAGLPIVRSLDALATQAESAKFQEVIRDVSDNIRQGKSFKESLEQYPKVFNELFVSMVGVGETSGTLEDVLEILARQMKRDYDLRSKIRGALTYPIAVISVMIVVGIIMMTTVIPKITDTFKELNVALPPMTVFVIALSDFMLKFWYFLPVIAGLIFYFFRRLLKTEAGKRSFGWLWLHLPPFSGLSRKINSARFSRTLASLVKSGVPIVKSLEITQNTLGNYFFKKSIQRAKEAVEKGKNLHETLEEYSDLYPPLVTQLIAVGEETGQLVDILARLALFYEGEVSRATKNMSTLIEPIIMIIIGAAVGFFAIAMIQPMYSIVQGF